MTRPVKLEIETMVCRPWTDGLAVTLGRPLVPVWVAGCPVRVPRFKRIGPPRHAVNRTGAQGQRQTELTPSCCNNVAGSSITWNGASPDVYTIDFESDLELSRI